DHVRTARAKGLGDLTVLFRHVLRNAAVPIVTVIGLGVALLIGGVVVTESVFSIPGLGRLTVDAVLARDYPTVQAVILLFSVGYGRAVCGAGVSLLVGASVALISTAIGLVIGMFAGYVRWLDEIVMRVMDGLMSIPAILLAIGLVSLSRAGLRTVIVAIVIPE